MNRNWYCRWLGHALSILRGTGYFQQGWQEFTHLLQHGQRDWDKVHGPDRANLVALYVAIYGQWHFFSMLNFLDFLTKGDPIRLELDGERVLLIDLGCGPGTVLCAAFDSRGMPEIESSVGCDASVAMCEFARQVLCQEGESSCRIENLTFGEGGSGADEVLGCLLGDDDDLSDFTVCITLSFLIANKSPSGAILASSAVFKNTVTRLVENLQSRGVGQVELICQNTGREFKSANTDYSRFLNGLEEYNLLPGYELSTTSWTVHTDAIEWDTLRALDPYVSLDEQLEQLCVDRCFWEPPRASGYHTTFTRETTTTDRI